MRFLVIIPTFDHGRTIEFAIRSILRQTYRNLRLAVIADGSPPHTHDLVRHFAAQDDRVALHVFPKGAGNGDAWRHEVLSAAQADAVAYCGDDDIWGPLHLKALVGLLRDADFAHTRHVMIAPNLAIRAIDETPADPMVRRRMIDELWNCFGPTCAGHRLDAYHRLPVGWSPGPSGVASDLNMWRKFLSQDWVRVAHSPVPTTLKLASPERSGWDEERRTQESRLVHDLFLDRIMWRALGETLPTRHVPVPLPTVVNRAIEIARTEPRAGRTRRPQPAPWSPAGWWRRLTRRR
jgi:GalNAc5-diNAcBac-PP-undecaprenol beta-1,3-glucosyltransferase